MSDFSYRGKLPFRIVSSSVNTGYNAELTSAVGQNIEIVNLHKDEYAELQDHPLQGPFTRTWVGGNQHRHTPLNDGEDTPETRAESFIISGTLNSVKIYGPDFDDIYRPRAQAFFGAKSSVNIKNIKSQDNRLGNFSHNYQIVQTSGRDINESFIKNDLTASGVLTTKFIEGVEDYTLPQEPNNKNVFVERFSAPGDWKESSRGALDRESEQYSPNNSLITRNISVRQKYNSQLTQHTPQFGSGSTYNLNPLVGNINAVTAQKINKNAIRRIKYEIASSLHEPTSELVTSSVFDNFWVQHAIPSSDLRYSWIAESVLPEQNLLEYQNAYDSEELLFNSSSLVVSGTNKEYNVDNFGINSLIKDKKYINLTTNTLQFQSGTSVSASFSEIANSAYQYSSWKQIRTGEHPVARKLRKANILSLEGIKSQIVNGTQLSSKRSNTVQNYIETPVTNKFKPLKQTLDIKDSTEKFTFTFTHENNFSTFANPEAIDKLGIQETSKEIYHLFRKYYKDPARRVLSKNPINDLDSYIYSETVYPREKNAFLAQTRGRTSYILTQSGTSVDGFDRQLGTQRVFWRDQQEDRSRSADNRFNSMNYQWQGIEESFAETGIEFQDLYFHDVEASLTMNGIIGRSFVENSVKAIDTKKNYESSFADLEQICVVTYEYTPLGQVNIRNKIIDNLNIGELNSVKFIDYFSSSSVGQDGLIFGEPPAEQLLFPSGPGQTFKPLMRVTDYSILWQNGGYDQNNYFGYSAFSSSLPVPGPSLTAFLGGFESGSRDYSSEMFFIFDEQPTGEIISTLDSGLRYDSSSFGSKKPWFDSYEEYSEDIKRIAKDHSILPEFIISNNMSFYIKEKDGNFRVTNRSFLELDGSGTGYRSSFNFNSLNYRQSFVDSILTTDVSKELETINSENTNLTNLDGIKITISGIKKLLPYNGFYPQDRTIQLANLFNEFLEENVGGGCFKYIFRTLRQSTENVDFLGTTTFEYNVDDVDYLYSKNVIMPYFFAPGILYNTIKSGISVDFPALIASASSEIIAKQKIFPYVTASILDQPIRQASLLSKNCEILNSSISSDWSSNKKDQLEIQASYIKRGAINRRLPFESLIFPETQIPKIKFQTSSFGYETEKTSSNAAETQDLELFDLYKKVVADSLISIKFDANIRPDIYRQNLYVDTDNYENYNTFGIEEKTYTPFAFLKNDSIINPSYSMAMSNFLAEIPRFFLRNYKLNSFKSSRIGEWGAFDTNKKYYFDLSIKKSKDLVMVESYKSEDHITGSNEINKTMNGRYFGWPVDNGGLKYYWFISGRPGIIRTDEDEYLVHNDPAYAPFTPPYFEGEAILRVELTPSSQSYNKISDAFADMEVTDIFPALENFYLSSSESGEAKTYALQNKMSLASCLEIFGIGTQPLPDFGVGGLLNGVRSVTDTENQYWVISPKLETPVLDFSEQQFQEHTGSYWKTGGFGRGMWSGYGKIPEGKNGITLRIDESFKNQEIDNSKTGSLLQKVKFTPESKKIGQLAETKEISEGVVLIPYVDRPIPGKTVFIDGHHFFAINTETYSSFKEAHDAGRPVSIPGEGIGYMSSITKMIDGMKNYVIPPNFNFYKYTDIRPFVMYVFEFKHNLDQQDLADIWQSVMPKIALNAQKEEITISHKMAGYELFGENFQIPENMKWMVFKVKKKAEWNYFAVTEQIGDDERFQFKFSNSQTARTPDYSYNWPYDYFSLVELAKVDISYQFVNKLTGST